MDTAQQSNEKFVRLINEHWVKYLQPTFVVIILSGLALALFYFWWLGRQRGLQFLDPLYFIALLVALLLHHWSFIFLFGEAADGVILTSRRLIHLHQRLYLLESTQDITYNQIKSVRADTRGLLHNILNYGDLVIDPGISISLIPRPHSVVKEIEQLMGMR